MTKVWIGRLMGVAMMVVSLAALGWARVEVCPARRLIP